MRAVLPSRFSSVLLIGAVHDMPPDRPATPLSAEQQIRLEKDLQAARDRQAAKAGASKPKSNAKDAKTGEKAGARTNP